MSQRSGQGESRETGRLADWVIDVVLTFLLVLVVPALFVISVMVTGFGLKVMDKAANGALLRNEGLGLILSAGFWALVFGLGLPLVAPVGGNVGEGLLILTLVGSIWGLGVGYQAVSELQENQLGANFTGLLAAPNDGVVIGADY